MELFRTCAAAVVQPAFLDRPPRTLFVPPSPVFWEPPSDSELVLPPVPNALAVRCIEVLDMMGFMLAGTAVGDGRAQEETGSSVNSVEAPDVLGKDVWGLILAYVTLPRLLAVRATSRFCRDVVDGMLQRRLRVNALRHVRVAIPSGPPSPPSPPRPPIGPSGELVPLRMKLPPARDFDDVSGESHEQQQVAQPMALEIFFLLQAVANGFRRVQLGKLRLHHSQSLLASRVEAMRLLVMEFNKRAAAAKKASLLLASQIDSSYGLEEELREMAQEVRRLRQDNVRLGELVIEVRAVVEHMFLVCSNCEIRGRFTGRGRLGDMDHPKLKDYLMPYAGAEARTRDRDDALERDAKTEHSSLMELPQWMDVMGRFAGRMQHAAAGMEREISDLNAGLRELSTAKEELQEQMSLLHKHIADCAIIGQLYSATKSRIEWCRQDFVTEVKTRNNLCATAAYYVDRVGDLADSAKWKKAPGCLERLRKLNEELHLRFPKVEAPEEMPPCRNSEAEEEEVFISIETATKKDDVPWDSALNSWCEHHDLLSRSSQLKFRRLREEAPMD